MISTSCYHPFVTIHSNIVDSSGHLPKTMPWVLSDLWETRLQVLPRASQVAQGLRICLSMQEMQETWVQSLRQEDPLEKETAPHFSTLARKIPRTEEPGGLESMRSQRVRHDRVVEHTAGSVQNLLFYWPPLTVNCGVGEDSWESLGLQGCPTSPS